MSGHIDMLEVLCIIHVYIGMTRSRVHVHCMMVILMTNCVYLVTFYHVSLACVILLYLLQRS